MNTASCDATIAFITTDGVFLNSYRTTNYSYSVAAAILIDAGGNTIVTYSIVGELEVGGIIGADTGCGTIPYLIVVYIGRCRRNLDSAFGATPSTIKYLGILDNASVQMVSLGIEGGIGARIGEVDKCPASGCSACGCREGYGLSRCALGYQGAIYLDSFPTIKSANLLMLDDPGP